MKVADVCAFYAPHGGGVRTYVERKLAYAEATGIDLAIIVPGETSRIERRGRTTRLVHIASPTLVLDPRYRYFAGAEAVHRILDRFAPNFVEASSPWRTASIVAAWQGAAPRALFMHADPLAAYAYRWLGGVMPRPAIDRSFEWFWAHLRRVSRDYAMVVAGNSNLSQRLRDGGVSRVATVPLGVEAGVFSPTRRDPGFRRALLASCELGEDALLLVGAGRHAPEKRWPTVIEAATLAGVQHPVGLVLAGEGRQRRRLLREIGDNPHVRLIAPIQDRAELARLFASADAMIHGCEAETFGLTAAEAVASGAPLIVPDEGGAADLASPERAEQYEAGNSASAAAAILRLASRDRQALTRAAQAAAGRIRTLDEHFDDLFGRYEAVIGARAVAA